MLKLIIILLLASTRFVKCEKCHHFFVVLSELDSKRSMQNDRKQQEPESNSTISPKEPPPPRKVSLCKRQGLLITVTGGVSFEDNND